MRDEVQGRLAFGEAGDLWMDAVRKRCDRFLAARIVDVERREPGRLERPLKTFQGCRGAPDAMEQNHSGASRAAHIRRLGHLSYATSRSGEDACSRAIVVAVT